MTSVQGAPSPAFEIPLDAVELALIGRITVVWSQIEAVVGILLRELLGITQQEFDARFGSKPISGQIEALERYANNLNCESSRDKLLAFCEFCESPRFERNHAIHGNWGYLVDSNGCIGAVHAAFRRRKDRPLPCGDLDRIYATAVQASLMADDLCVALLDYPKRPAGGRRMFLGHPPTGWECAACAAKNGVALPR